MLQYAYRLGSTRLDIPCGLAYLVRYQPIDVSFPSRVLKCQRVELGLNTRKGT